MASLTYQVIVRPHGRRYIATVPDLACQALGASAADAVVAVRDKALTKLDEYVDGPFDLPRPSQVELVRIELPVPPALHRARRASHLRVVPDPADCQPRRQDHDATAELRARRLRT